MGTPLRAVAYLRVSTEEQATSGLGIEAQSSTISAAVTARGWSPLAATFIDEAVSGKTAPASRPALSEALTMLDAGEADVLVVAKLDRLTRSMLNLAELLERADKAKWALVILDADVDTTTAGGRLVANMLGSVAEWERMVIGERTRAALAAKKASGVKLGRPNEQSAEDLARIRELRAAGLSIRKIADTMTGEGRTTARGNSWHPTSISRALKAA